MKCEQRKPNLNQKSSLVVKQQEIENLKHKLYYNFLWIQLTKVELIAIDFN